MGNHLNIIHIAELMGELRSYQQRIVVIKIGGNSIAEDDQFLSKIARQILFLKTNGVKVILVHGGGPQIDQALYDKNIQTKKSKDGRRITSPAAMRVVSKVLKSINMQIVKAFAEAGLPENKIIAAHKLQKLIVEAEPIDPANPKTNRSGIPVDIDRAFMNKALAKDQIVILHSIAIGKDKKTTYNTNGDDYAMAVARGVRAKRLILVTNVSGVYDKDKQRIPLIESTMARNLIEEGVISGGMIPKVESALRLTKQGVGGVVIIDGFPPWSILGELLTRHGRGTLFQSRH
ncbi:MAG: acetylglutamate kinase [Alphaproteobacteria bacterium]|nr:acetylglutamate kinase [Alphaproteobacteria bacterium]